MADRLASIGGPAPAESLRRHLPPRRSRQRHEPAVRAGGRPRRVPRAPGGDLGALRASPALLRPDGHSLPRARADPRRAALAGASAPPHRVLALAQPSPPARRAPLPRSCHDQGDRKRPPTRRRLPLPGAQPGRGGPSRRSAPLALEQRPRPRRLEQPWIPLAESDLRAAFGDADDWRERYRSTIDGGRAEELPEPDVSS